MSLLEFNRRQLLQSTGKLLTLAAFSDLHSRENSSAPNYKIPPKAKRIIYICNSGGPSHVDLYDYKPQLQKWHGKEIPDSIKGNQRLTSVSNAQTQLPISASEFTFSQNKATGIYLSDLLKHTNSISENICLINSMTTDEINHDPGICRLLTGSSRAGNASIGSWTDYGLGSLNKNLPSFIVMISRSSISNQSLNERLWNNGFLPPVHQGTKFYGGKRPVLFLKSPKEISPEIRSSQIELIKDLNEQKYKESNDSEILARNAKYEMAFRMQTSIPELTDLSKESTRTLEMYGPDVNKPGTFAYNCLMARRMAERNVKFIQLFHRGWDHHRDLVRRITESSKAIDQPTAALIKDLKRLGLFEDTLIVCSSEFGRAPYCQGSLGAPAYGRDHHGKCFSAWIAGAGIKKGIVYGKSDDFAYNITENPVSVDELNATILHLLGIDHNKLTYFHQGLEQRLTGVEPVKVVKDILS